MKPYWLYMTTALVFYYAVHAQLTENRHQEELYRYKAELSKYYVVQFADHALAAYNKEPEQRPYQYDVSRWTAELWQSVTVGPAPQSEDAWLSRGLRAFRLPDKFLAYDVYRVFSARLVTFPQTYEFIVGLDDRFNFVRLYGFQDPIYRVGDMVFFGLGSDVLNFGRADLPVNDKDELDRFMGDWIRITQLRGGSLGFKVVSNQLESTQAELDSGYLKGTCKTANLFFNHNESKKKIRYQEWRYRILPNPSSLELVSEREDEDLSVFSGP